LEQCKKLGVSADWRRLRFTLDDKYADAVLEAFVTYYNEGLLYRGEKSSIGAQDVILLFLILKLNMRN